MRVVLREEIEGLGYPGDCVRVRDGYGRNYLIPRGLAVLATPGALRAVEQAKEQRRRVESRARDQFEKLAATLAGKTVRVEKRAGSGMKLYGSVTTADIAEALKAQYGLDIERRRLELESQIKTVGTHEVTARVSADVHAKFLIEVVREGGEPVAEEAAAATEAPEVVEAPEAPAADAPAAEEPAIEDSVDS
ncbi:MAG TPA: 50S ribosomal protein L9 [Armatimonadota bacterium]|nr:50S ribosomal protein L9 [Armatimonadota bacterium]HQK95925.1 50S ribosomal protein L9 [Armatimonadota bacterium]